MACQVSGEPPKSTRVFGVHRSSSSILTAVSTSPRTKPNLHNQPSTNNHQHANKIFQKIACEIFHDLAFSRGFRPRVGQKSVLIRGTWCLFEQVVARNAITQNHIHLVGYRQRSAPGSCNSGDERWSRSSRHGNGERK